MSEAKVDWAEDAETRILDAAITLAPALGWGQALVERAARDAGLSKGEALLLLPSGPRDLAALLSRRHDQAAIATLAKTNPKALKVRERIQRGVEARMDAAFADEPALRRWAGFLSLPPNLPLAMRLVWESADGLWRWAGDTATDENHYSKRAILSGVLASTLAVRLSGGPEAARAHLKSRIDAVMAFEAWKAKVRPLELAQEIARALGRARYGRAA
jgi:ubiquinone biosynthesis protein COQ9